MKSPYQSRRRNKEFPQSEALTLMILEELREKFPEDKFYFSKRDLAEFKRAYEEYSREFNPYGISALL